MSDNRLYLYIMGSKNKEDRISTAVPYKINEEELFFGPCNEEFLGGDREKLDLDNSNKEIYIAGINPSYGKPRKFLFLGKIKTIFSFKTAWEHYQDRNDLDIKLMIKRKYSPLHLKPIPEGYKHRTKEHSGKWIEDITSQKPSNEKEIYRNGIITNKETIFNRDCCFSMDNIFFSLKGDHVIKIDKQFIDLIKKGMKKTGNQKRIETHIGSDETAPFGYCENGTRYGRGFTLILKNNDVDKFLELIDNKIN
ncbi:MAG: hypothetical protein GF329_09445 [Candidatus Lokiarchaeota archaeon]|nr:hypothetical protein [Candidatus Lokiarchaeota archaeon]